MGINVPQYEVFKIGTSQLKYHNWDLNITEKDARDCNEMVSLFEAEEFRIISRILKKPIKELDFSKLIVMIVIDNPKHFDRAVDKSGIIINGEKYNRFVGTTGGLKNHTLLFVRSDLLDPLNEYCKCNRKDIPIVPAKLEAYKALYCSASQPICFPENIVVVPDCIITGLKADIIKIRDDENSIEPIVEEVDGFDIENTASDGFSLCTYEFMTKISESLNISYVPGGVCIRAPWLKGMLYPFPIHEFIDEYNNDNYIITDSWGIKRDITNCDMIITESCLKMWKAYDSSEDYIAACREYQIGFSVTKISADTLEDIRELNYQYLQSYEFDSEDIEELCKPTVDYLKNACCGDYETTKEFLGISHGASRGTWQSALSVSEYMINDPYVIDSVHRMIRNKIDQAKIGKLRVHGNYQIASGDPFALMQSICGLSITGLLKAGQVYSSYWVNEQVNEVVVFRSPMTSHNNICKCEVVNTSDVKKWFRYMKGIMILNGFDTMCQSLNGCDYDGDLLFSTNNKVLLRRFRQTRPIIYIQQNAEKIIPTDEDILTTNFQGMGNKVGTITNRITAMFDKQIEFEKDSPEWIELQRRIDAGEKYQQDQIDKLKGIIAKPMPEYWYDIKKAKEQDSNNGNFYTKTCTHKKPYFMTYIYADYRQTYREYVKKCDLICENKFSMTYEDLKNETSLNSEQEKFLKYFKDNEPFSMNNCAMNQICRHIENEFKGYQLNLKHNSSFDYHNIQPQIIDGLYELYYEQLKNLMKEYASKVKKYKDSKRADYSSSRDGAKEREDLRRYYKREAKRICADDNTRCGIVLDICYGESNGNPQYCWDCVGDIIVDYLKEIAV